MTAQRCAFISGVSRDRHVSPTRPGRTKRRQGRTGEKKGSARHVSARLSSPRPSSTRADDTTLFIFVSTFRRPLICYCAFFIILFVD